VLHQDSLSAGGAKGPALTEFDSSTTIEPVSARSGGSERLSGDQFDRIAKALADPTRVAVLEAIGQQDECPCQRLRDVFPVTKATISHHIKELVRAGLVEARREGQYLHCQLKREVLRGYTNELLRRAGEKG
jgi:ArsR family transcriptional regulator, arsenate/arsenite/antimonite-responsive transcriptional repressor